jgi:hypothetical protein
MVARNDEPGVVDVSLCAFKIVRHGANASHWEVSPGRPWATALLRKRGVRKLIRTHHGITYTNPVLSVSFRTRGDAENFLRDLEWMV